MLVSEWSDLIGLTVTLYLLAPIAIIDNRFFAPRHLGLSTGFRAAAYVLYCASTDETDRLLLLHPHAK